jgi:hypothetical protein
MKLDNIKFIERNTAFGKQLGIVMPGGHWVMKNTLMHAYAALIANWPEIDWSLKQTSKSMIGIASWGAPYQKGLNQALGRSVKFFVTHDMLPSPLEVACKCNGDPYKGGSVKYVPRGSRQPKSPVVLTVPLIKSVGPIDPRTIVVPRSKAATTISGKQVAM